MNQSMKNNRKLWIIGGIAGAVILCICVVLAGMAVAGSTIFSQTREIIEATSEIVDQPQEPGLIATATADASGENPALPSSDRGWEGWTAAQQEEEISMAKGSADAFLSLWMSGETDAAYELVTTEMQESLGGVEGLDSFFESVGAAPESWEWDEPGFIDIDAGYPVIELNGIGIFTAGQRAPVQIQMEWTGDLWKVRYININGE